MYILLILLHAIKRVPVPANKVLQNGRVIYTFFSLIIIIDLLFTILSENEISKK